MTRIVETRTRSAVLLICSVYSAGFTFLVWTGFPVVIDSSALERTAAEFVLRFCLLTYLSLQAAVIWHDRRNVHTWRATFHLWLLGLFPLWSIPAALALFEGVVSVTKRLYLLPA